MAVVILLLLSNLSNAHAQARADAFDPKTHADGVRAAFRDLLRGRTFEPIPPTPDQIPSWNCGEANAPQCAVLLTLLTTENFVFISPYQFSSQGPSLPEYERFRAGCPNFRFEQTLPFIIPPATATRNFGVYRLVRPGDAPADHNVHVYRAELYTAPPHPLYGEVRYDGYFIRFYPPSCLELPRRDLILPNSRRSREHRDRIISINEPIFIADEFALLHVYPVFVIQDDRISRVYYSIILELLGSRGVERSRQFAFESRS